MPTYRVRPEPLAKEHPHHPAVASRREAPLLQDAADLLAQDRRAKRLAAPAVAELRHNADPADQRAVAQAAAHSAVVPCIYVPHGRHAVAPR